MDEATERSGRDGEVGWDLLSHVEALAERLSRLEAENAELKAQSAEQAEMIARLASSPPSVDSPVPPINTETKVGRRGVLRKVLGVTASAAVITGAMSSWTARPDTISGTGPDGNLVIGSNAFDNTANYGSKTTSLVSGLNFAGRSAFEADAGPFQSSGSANSVGVAGGPGGSGAGVFGADSLNTFANTSGWPAGRTPVLCGSGNGAGIVGVRGTSRGSAGVWGNSLNYDGIHGESSSGNGIYGQSNSNAGVYGKSSQRRGVRGLAAGVRGRGHHAGHRRPGHVDQQCRRVRQVDLQRGRVRHVASLRACMGNRPRTSPSTAPRRSRRLRRDGTGPPSSARRPSPSGFAGQFAGASSSAAASPSPAGPSRPPSSARTAATPACTARRARSPGSRTSAPPTLKNGQASVALSADFDEVVDGTDYRVFLTEIGDCGGLYVSRKGPHRFEVKSRARRPRPAVRSTTAWWPDARTRSAGGWRRSTSPSLASSSAAAQAAQSRRAEGFRRRLRSRTSSVERRRPSLAADAPSRPDQSAGAASPPD